MRTTSSKKTVEGRDTEELVEEEGSDDDFEGRVDLRKEGESDSCGFTSHLEQEKTLTKENEWNEKSATLSTSTVMRVMLLEPSKKTGVSLEPLYEKDGGVED